MLQPRTKWQLPELDHAVCARVSEEMELSSPIARMLVHRGFTAKEQIERFLYPLMDHLHSPFLLDGMNEAVKRINQAIELKEKIVIYGDYDVDGISSTSLLLKVFHELKANVDYYIPNRFTEGYGLNSGALERIKENGAQLVITVDTGISAVEEARFAKELSLDLIITDHHEPPEKLPEAYTVINPKKENCPYPYKMLAGVGVAFKLATALLNRVPEELLDIVALGTIADLVPLVDENRVLAYYGLKRMNLRRNEGLRALLEVCGVNEEITESHIGFGVGPRINASGRLDSANQAVQLLTTDDVHVAKRVAEDLDELNRERQRLVEEMTQEAILQIEENRDPHQHFILVSQKDWHLGVVGIVASRLVEKYYRPVIVLSIDEETGIAKGSARGIASFNLYEALTQCKEHLLHYGGHTMAAGMALLRANISSFHQQLAQIAKETLSAEDYVPVTMVEDELLLEHVSEQLIGEIKQLAPFGMGNPVPYFALRELNVSRMQRLGEERNHLKLFVKNEQSSLDAIGFRFGEMANHIAKAAQVDLIGELQINEWNGRRSPQLLIRDLAVPHFQVFDWRSNRDIKQRLENVNTEQCTFLCLKNSPNAKVIEGTFLQRILYWEELNQEAGSLNPYVVIVDPPPSMGALDKVLRCCKDIERLYFMFGDKEFDDVLVRAPSREDFKAVYGALVQKKRIHLTKDISQLVRFTGVGIKSIQFIFTVLKELDLVEEKNAYVLCNHSSGKKELINSTTYCEQLEKEKVLEVLVHSSHEDLCAYLRKSEFKFQCGGKAYALQR